MSYDVVALKCMKSEARDDDKTEVENGILKLHPTNRVLTVQREQKNHQWTNRNKRVREKNTYIQNNYREKCAAYGDNDIKSDHFHFIFSSYFAPFESLSG